MSGEGNATSGPLTKPENRKVFFKGFRRVIRYTKCELFELYSEKILDGTHSNLLVSESRPLFSVL